MNKRILRTVVVSRKLGKWSGLSAGIALWLLSVTLLPAAEQMTRLDARSGSKMRLEGSSGLHDWQAESRIIAGSLGGGPTFPIQLGKPVTPAKAEARGAGPV